MQDLLTSYKSANSVCLNLPEENNSLILMTSFSVNTECELSSPFAPPFECGFCNPFLYECNWFSEDVTHSRLSTLLFVLSPSLWFTSGLFSGFGMNAIATKRCIDMYFTLLSIGKPTLKYPHRVGRCFKNFSLRSLLCRILLTPTTSTYLSRDLTLPRFEISYIPSNSSIGLNISFIYTNINKINELKWQY